MGDAACDETVSGAGRWRLCLQEHTKLSADEIRSRQTRKSMLRPVRPSTREKRRDNGAQKQSMDVVRHLCGSDCAAMLATSGRFPRPVANDEITSPSAPQGQRT